MSTKTKARKDVYSIVTEKIIEQLEQGTVPWKKPWADAGIPSNVVSGRPYRGVNIMLLSMLGYEQNLFLTSKQLKEIGGTIKPEEHPNLVVYWNYPQKDSEEEENEKDTKRAPLLRYYTVFNISQCEGIPEKYVPEQKEREVKPDLACKLVVKNMPNPPRIQHKEQKAYYNPIDDYINMPRQKSFESDDAYYATLFHEMVHSTGHRYRLHRKELLEMSEFGSEPYSHEELVAEIGSCFLQSHAHITERFEQSTAYIQGWLEVFKGNRKFIFSASTAAQKAVDYILNIEE